MESYIAGINDALEAGLTATLGVSNFDLGQLKRAVSLSRHPIVANQVLYNLFENPIVTPEFREYCLSEGISIVAYRPLERKKLADQCDRPEIVSLARKYDRPVAHIALNWLMGQKGVTVIPKASRREHIDENLLAAEFELASEDRQTLDDLARKIAADRA